ncbi:hypothetical protein AX769_21035 (plasmid) [Frondihabitans sp. PAMC 28766]|uniref:GntR family transcriptional regulator n=1 Tax=Frondihabitans sp. PAMC 28766 TaxID=1795630 RepID=UPI00078E56BB|nr:GntR family transcriptional regulator [Frondihabitans sp. PAMC 28766]AMM22629.1 hypothetical protein AX769_21035 [Frondihabitans sp. PAMC 28766]
MIQVDDTDPTPVFEQLRVQISNQIRLGTLPTDARLPTVRQLAADLRISPGTVARTYSLLEADGLIVTRRSAGTRVSIQADNYPHILDAALDFTATIRQQGLTLEQAILAVRAAWETDSDTNG